MNEVVPIDSIKEMGPMGIMLLAGIVSWCFLGWLVPSLRRGYLDQPNARSSHKVPTPRGGDIAFVVVSCLLSPLVMGGTAAWIPLLCMPLSIVGLIDDRVDLPAGVRYAAQLATALALLLISPLPHPAWSYPILLVSITAVINFTNFMDGLDGLVGLCCFVIMAAVGMWTIAGALLGFLLWNWSPAKVFMGDVGSTWLGAVIAGIALQKATVSEAFAVLLLGSPLLGDALICVLLRLRAGQPVFEAHRLHLFQRLQRSGWPHAKVSTVYGLATAAITMALLTKGVIAEVLAVAATMLAALILNKRCAVPFAASRTQS